MNQIVSSASNGSIEQMESAANSLAETIRRDPILLMRLHAVKLLGELNCSASIDALVDASKDHNSDVRIAAIQSWSKLPGEVAIGHLQEIIGSDTDVDVRLAATRALGNFHGKQAIEALALALQDNDPALQLRATESLGRVTGESIGRNVNAWRQYVQDALPQKSTVETGNTSPTKTIESMAQGDDDSFFR